MKKLLLYLLLLGSCDSCYMDYEISIAINNQSNRPLYVYLQEFYSNRKDTVIPKEGEEYWLEEVPGNMKEYVTIAGADWETEFRAAKIDTLHLFLIDEDTLKKYGWETMRINYLILQRYDLSIKDLVRLNYTVDYPPTPAMRDIKMWPSYAK